MAKGVPLVHRHPSIFVRRVVIAILIKERERERRGAEIATPSYTSQLACEQEATINAELRVDGYLIQFLVTG
uniref:Uncharacterized protein n=1 Tax=Nelumbo nucifera TaxID=4432 RepID=A0A822ZI23_NELNU|nr:TPA_asm: hypothetical protein HUJ06_002513 [Nelumbo nucifera]